ncbi:maleylpyruvate isomerase family mycothiol-dependent enzyme [Streptomyces sp. NPDC126514]|uniref:maleylpyruvate isomerase family mycothiol-dependent enzyme n=1 Tax=Streptomyces sp. NPDC126514 TaxID=3155210 RepID=UPI003327469E
MSGTDMPPDAGAQAVDRSTLIAALHDVWESLDDVLARLTPAQWALATCLLGWTVSDVVAHVTGTECMLAGDPVPAVTIDVSSLPHVANDIGAANEIWVQALRATPGAEMLRLFRDAVCRRREALERTTQADFDAPSWTPAGEATYGRFMQLRVYDTWMHEQDIRTATGIAGHCSGPAATVSFAELRRALGYIVGKRAALPNGTSVRFDLTGALPARIDVMVEGRAQIVQLDKTPTVTLCMPSELLMWLSGGRSSASGHSSDIEIRGDDFLGRRVLDHLAFTI